MSPNPLFMVKPEFDKTILPGTALSRSRFEDNTFSHGENLKSGITTDWGTVKVKQHTECGVRNMVLNILTNIFLENGYE